MNVECSRGLDHSWDASSPVTSCTLLKNFICLFEGTTCSLPIIPAEGGAGISRAVVRALASHRCGPGSIPGPGVTCGLSLLLVFVLAPRVFLQVLQFSSLHKNQQF